MDWHTDLYPTDYWTEAPPDVPALQVQSAYSGAPFRIVRCYINQEGGLSARTVETTEDPEDAARILGQLQETLKN